ncbi:MAG: hypothetical protein RL318_2036 [Fibrobacterota bacterium]|jgi:bifunctional NMN adenylyltransferase/nudix hydrolase
MTEFDIAVLIGRFQPFHHGHGGLLRKALDTAPRIVVVLGSAFAAPSPRNPFSAAQREAMIRSWLSPEENARTAFVPQRDVWNSKRWARDVHRSVSSIAQGRVALVGYHKDGTSAYLDTFPEWTMIDAGRQGPLDATPLRRQILSNTPWSEVEGSLQGAVPDSVLALLGQWAREDLRSRLAADQEAIETYQARWGKGPFLTVDAVVKACDHILLIRRGARPGIGLRALPGGFLDPHEALEDGARRELLEETGLDLGALQATGTRMFAHPGRSARARIVTHAFLFEPVWTSLPEVTAADDALDARWIPISELAAMEDEFFGDHFHIIDQMLGILDT